MIEEAPLKSVLDLLSIHPDYRIVSRYKRPEYYNLPISATKKLGLVVDVETTGLDPENNKILEVALLPFEYSDNGKIYNLLPGYEGFEDPLQAIPKNIVELTGITDAMVAGKKFDETSVKELVEKADLIIAHNAYFDRRFLELRFPAFKDKAWACSFSQIPWQSLGIESGKLSYIAYKYGFFFEGHRALNDCEACLHILAQDLPKLAASSSGLKLLIDGAAKIGLRLFAVSAPFEKKDLLKARGYNWNDGNNGRPKAWYKDLLVEEEAAELEFLNQEIYYRKAACTSVALNALNRFSNRI
jgi:DNA polymerase-3 subunit epsilon